MLNLCIESDDSRPRSLRIERFPCRIGRHRDNEVVLASWRAAKVHAEIQRIERGFKLVDGGSILGTWVNGERIIEYGPLDQSDEIVIAGFRIHLEAAALALPRLASVSGNPPEGGAYVEAQAADDAAMPVSDMPEAPGQGAHSSIEWRRTCIASCSMRSTCAARTSGS